MAFDPIILSMEHRAQTKIGFEGAEYGFQIGQSYICTPQFFCIPAHFIAPQTINARMRQLRTIDWLFRPGDGSSQCAGLIRHDGDIIMLCNAMAFLFEPSNALLD